MTELGSRTADYDFALPADRIAQAPLARRDESRLMVVDRGAGRVSHRVFRDIVELIAPGADGSHSYRVELGLKPLGGTALSRLVARIVAGTTPSAEAQARGKEQQLSLSFTRQVPAGPVALDYLALNLGDTPPGRYRVTVRVTDLATGRSAVSERDLVIIR